MTGAWLHLHVLGALAFKSARPWLALAALAVLLLTMALAWRLQVGPPRRRAWLMAAALRLLAAGLLLLALLEPVVARRELIPGRSFLVHLYDTSASMGIEDERGEARLETTARAAASPARHRLDQLFQPIEFAFAETLRPHPSGAPLAPAGGATKLADALGALQAKTAGLPVAGVILYSDGGAADAEESRNAAAAAARLHLPIYPIGCAPSRPGPDLWIEALEHPDEVFTRTQIKIGVTVQARGLKGRPIEILLSDETREIERRKFVVAQDEQTLRAEMTIAPAAAGFHHYRVTATAPGAPDSYPWNNSEDFLVRVRKSRHAILYVEARPRFEYRFVQAAFADDDRFRLVSLVGLDRQGHFYRQGVNVSTELQGGFPKSEDELASFEAVVLGDVAAASFTPRQLELLRAYVERRGGGLILLAGDDSFAARGFGPSPLADLLPVRLAEVRRLTQPGRVAPTAAGIQRAIFGPGDAAGDPARAANPPWAALPPTPGLFTLGALKPGAEALAVAEQGRGARNPAVIAWQRAGQGVVLVCGISATWLWKMQSPADSPTHAAFWKQLLLLALRQDEARLEVGAVPPVALPGESVTIQGTLPGETGPAPPASSFRLRLEAPGGKTIDVIPESDPQRRFAFRATLKAGPPGVYKLAVSLARTVGQVPKGEPLSGETMFLVRAGSPELLRSTSLNEGLLRAIAQASGGRYLHHTQFDRLPGLIETHAEARLGVQEQSLWDHPALYGLILVLLLAAWLAGRWGKLA